MTGVFADNVAAYALAGWPCVMPVPPVRKSPPPEGFTGAGGKDTDAAQLVAWAGTHAEHSIALRLPEGVIGIDVDHYDKTSTLPSGETKTVAKRGAETLAAREAQWGALPPTFSSTARGSAAGPGPSRVLFYRVPPGRYATKLGSDIDIIQRHHRYVVVAPSRHAEAGTYTWYGPDDAPTGVPAPGALAPLPPAWVSGLAEGAGQASAPAAPVEAGMALLAGLLTDEREPCAEVANAAARAVDAIIASDSGSRHDTATERTHHLVQVAAAGHPGAGPALVAVRDAWEQTTAGEGRTEEFERMLLTSARKAVSVVGASAVDRDPCLWVDGPIWAAPAPGDDRGEGGRGGSGGSGGADGAGEEVPGPLAPPRRWHIREAIGAHAFDPPGLSDQTLAKAVLARMYPGVRYAYDSGAWLIRGPECWETRAEQLPRWMVAELAELMPLGNPDAEKGSEALAQHQRRVAFTNNAKSGSIAGKVAALVAGGTHPATLKESWLDAEPDVLWAGGLPWDLRHSTAELYVAPIDPATPHLHAAALAPAPVPTPRFDAFLDAVWPDAEVRTWALRVLAIAFTGYADAALPILLGETRRGKSQVVSLLMSVLGSYAHSADPRLLGGLDKTHASIVYALKGRRLSFIDEGPRDGKLGQERLKQLTGGADLTANQMNANPVTFSPTHTLVLTANDEPALTDPAIRARVRLIPCTGDPEEVRRSRAAIGHTHGAIWRAEAPGVLAMMIREAAAWLTEPSTAGHGAAPASIRYLAEEMAVEQDPILTWLSDATEPYEPGTRSRELFTAFVGWCRDGNIHPSRIPTETRWGRDITKLGYPPVSRRNANYRQLRMRPDNGGFPLPAPRSVPDMVYPESVSYSENLTRPTNRSGQVEGVWIDGGGLADKPSTPENTSSNTVFSLVVEGVEGLKNPIYKEEGNTPYIQGEPLTSPKNPGKGGLTLNAPHVDLQQSADLREPGVWSVEGPAASVRNPPTEPVESDYDDLETEISAGQPAYSEVPADPVTKSGRKRLSEAEKAARAEARRADAAAQRSAAMAEAVRVASGPIYTLPVVVDRAGTIEPVDLAGAGSVLAEVITTTGQLDADVESTGYPIGHALYALRTIQLGDRDRAVVFDAADPAHRDLASIALRAAPRLGAFSATADLVPLAVAGVIEDIDEAWQRMHDAVIPVKLTDPASTSDVEGLKAVAAAVLPEPVSPAAEQGRKTVFKAGRWLEKTKIDTPIERSGWAQIDHRCAAMLRYAASDVLDTAALPAALPAVPDQVMERERTAQRVTARVAHLGLLIDGEHVASLLPPHREARDEAAGRVRSFGIDNPGSDQQIGLALAQRGASLPLTPRGKPSVAKGVLDGLRAVEGEIGAMVDAVLEFRHHDTAIGTFLEPYEHLVTHGDGRARPTVYTMEAKTGRMSCVRPNLQQVPREGGFRACLTADPGYVLISADFASVEIRVAAALSQDPTLMSLLADGVDVHSVIAELVFGKEFTKSNRYSVKRAVFGWLYGAGLDTLAGQVGGSMDIARDLVTRLTGLAPGLVAWSQSVQTAVRAGHTRYPTYSGRVAHLRQPHSAPNYCVQGTARELLVDALIRWELTPWGRSVLLPVHDEVIAMVRAEEAADATAALITCMETDLMGVRIKAEASQPSFAWADAA